MKRSLCLDPGNMVYLLIMLKRVMVLSLFLGCVSCDGPNRTSLHPLPRITTTHTPAGASSVFFSPKGGCSTAVAGFIGSAKKSVHLQAYGFTSDVIARALIEAKQHGREVEVLLDRSEESDPRSKLAELHEAGVSVWLDKKHAIAHNKVVVLDGGERFETGSFNFTQAAETSNAENCYFPADPTIGAQYEANFQAHKAHSVLAP